jgi:hypothetical protein
VTGYDDERDQARAAYADLRRDCRPLPEDTSRSATRRSLPWLNVVIAATAAVMNL